ncbi:hypothetical protein [Streptomyces sp. NPDC004685]
MGVRPSKDWPAAHRPHHDCHLSIVKALRLPALELMIEPPQQSIELS